MPRPRNEPAVDLNEFTCPHCGVYSSQAWGGIPQKCGGQLMGVDVPGFKQCTCLHCTTVSIWHDGKLIFPPASSAPPPAADLPDDIKGDFNEAREVLRVSPRGAAALLRLCIQKLCKELGEPGQNINNDIASLVGKGLPPQIQQSLDIVRVVGNECVHPGTLDLRDDVETAVKLFGLVNLIVEVMITQPKQVQAMYDSVIPPAKRAAIQQRDTP